MFWKLDYYPDLTHHVFLSHCHEDRNDLVLPVYQGLIQHGLRPWLDQADYSYGRTSRAALRDGILRSRHTIFFITEAMLSNSRGWCVLELAYTELLDATFQRGAGHLLNQVLPIFFVPQNHELLPRTVWQHLRDRGVFMPMNENVSRISWVIDQIQNFILRETEFAQEMAKRCRKDKEFRRVLREETPGLFDRVTKFSP